MNITLPEEFKLKFRNLVTLRSGLYFKDYDLKDLENALLYRMCERKIDSPLTYYSLLTVSEGKEDEFRELLNHLTVNHTYFFRNEPQFKALKEKILPEIIARKKDRMITNPRETDGKPSLRIWSAGCSTGEEPYSIAIVVKEAIPDSKNWNIQIVATDASTSALEVARKGTYGQNSMRLVSKEQRALYFIERTGTGRKAEYEIQDMIKNMVRFGYFNLMEENYPVEFDIIFCCNVTIYFEIETTMRVMDKIYHSLNDDGYLFIGYSESLQLISNKFKMLDWEDAIYYRKRTAKEVLSEIKVLSPQGVEVERVLEEISRKELEAQLKEFKSPETKPVKNIDELLTQVIKHLHTKKYYMALELVEQAHKMNRDSVEPYYLEAEALLSLGRFNDAKDRLKTALKLNPLFAPAHYLFGSLFNEEGKVEEAKRSFIKALYLNKDFTLAHFGLANIYKSEGKLHEAIREYRNTLNILAKNAPDDIIAYSGGFSAVAVAGACKSNIERLKTSA
ncbi:MAG: CheR family methyltransferase [Thermodesulfobacteriota bacterium]